MEGSKLVTVLSKFNSSELLELEYFLSSPYFNRLANSKKNFKLFKLIIESNPALKGTNIRKEVVYNQIFPEDEKPINGKLEKLMSGLLALIEKFIVIHFSEFLKSREEYFLSLTAFYRKRQLPQYQYQYLKKINSELDSPSIYNSDYFFTKYRLSQESELFNSRKRIGAKDDNLIILMNNFDRYVVFSKLEHSLSLLARRVNISIEFSDSLELAELFIPLINNREHLKLPVFQCLYAAFNLLKYFNDSAELYYYELKGALENTEHKLADSTKKSLLTILRIYAIGQANLRKEEFIIESFRLFKKHLEEGDLYYEGKIRPASIRNIIKLGLLNNKVNWVEKFLDQNKGRIGGTMHPLEVYNLNKSEVFFYKKEYEKALEILSFTFEDFYSKIEAKRLEIKIFYELKNILTLESKLEAFKVFIIRLSKKALPPKQRKLSTNFIGLVKQMIHPKTFLNPKRVNKLIEKANLQPMLAEKKWILDKLNELKK